MVCPWCSCEMEKGELRSKGGVYYLPEGEKTPLLYTQWAMDQRRAVYLPPYMLGNGEYPRANICRSCSKIVIDY